MATFDALLDGTGAEAVHHVDETLLARAQSDGPAAVRQDARYAVGTLEQADAIVCTCSTLGPLMDGFDIPHLLRIDRPAFEAAVNYGPRIMLVLCLASTKDASEQLLHDYMGSNQITPTTVICADAWPAFEAGDTNTFHTMIANDIRQAAAQQPFDAVILAQASMAGAAAMLTDLGILVLATPAMAVQAARAIAQGQTDR